MTIVLRTEAVVHNIWEIITLAGQFYPNSDLLLIEIRYLVNFFA